jgi:hypothetical protein
MMEKTVYYGHELYKVGGVGRVSWQEQLAAEGVCMCRGNKKRDVKIPLQDFDAVSPYPSACARFYAVSGIFTSH